MTDAVGDASAERADQPVSIVASGPIGVVLVNYGSHQLVARAAEALSQRKAAAVGIDVKIIVVDNFSTLAEQQTITSLGRDGGWTVLPMPDNRGFGAGCNAGVAEAFRLGCDRFLLLNPDAMVDCALVAAIGTELAVDHSAVVAPRIVDSGGAEVFAGARLNLRDGRIRSKRPPATEVARPSGAEELEADGDWVPWLTGACFAMHRAMWDTIGGFRDPFFLYWEDVDLTVRAFRAGGRLVVRQDLVAVHDEGGTQGARTGRAKSAIYYDWNCRNRLRFAAETLSRAQILRWMLVTPAVSWEILMRGGKRQLIDHPTLLWAAIRGTGVGLGLAVRGLVRRPVTVRGDALPGGRAG